MLDLLSVRRLEFGELPGGLMGKESRQAGEGILAPAVKLIGMDAMLGGELADGLFFLEHGQHQLGLEFGGMLSSHGVILHLPSRHFVVRFLGYIIQTTAAGRSPETYTVQQAAALTGLSEHTLRYYERIGLIQPVQRQHSSGHRRYGPADLARLESLACLRATGMPIEQMRHYFALRARGADAAAEQQALLTAHLQELHRRMAALQHHIQYVDRKIDYWHAIELQDEPAAARIALEVHELARATTGERGQAPAG